MQNLTALVRAFNTLTSDATDITANDTVTIGGVVYTFKASVTTTANEVKVGGTAAVSLANLKKAINASDTSVHGSLTVPNPYVVATVVTATTLKVVARLPGTIGNFIPCLATSTHLNDWTAAVCASGTGNLATVFTEILAAAQLKADLFEAVADIESASIVVP